MTVRVPIERDSLDGESEKVRKESVDAFYDRGRDKVKGNFFFYIRQFSPTDVKIS